MKAVRPGSIRSWSAIVAPLVAAWSRVAPLLYAAARCASERTSGDVRGGNGIAFAVLRERSRVRPGACGEDAWPGRCSVTEGDRFMISGPPPPAASLLVVDATVLPMTGPRAVLEHHDVLALGPRIAAMGPT